WLFCFASILTLLFVFFYRYGHNRDLHSFPTRRSSDLSSLVLDFQRMGGTVLISEIEEDPFEMLEMSGLSEVIGEDHFFKTTTEAINFALTLIDPNNCPISLKNGHKKCQTFVKMEETT